MPFPSCHCRCGTSSALEVVAEIGHLLATAGIYALNKDQIVTTVRKCICQFKYVYQRKAHHDGYRRNIDSFQWMMLMSVCNQLCKYDVQFRCQYSNSSECLHDNKHTYAMPVTNTDRFY
jgi:hypothetical protein